MHGEDRPNIKTQLIIGALKFTEFPDHISIDYDAIQFDLLGHIGCNIIVLACIAYKRLP